MWSLVTVCCYWRAVRVVGVCVWVHPNLSLPWGQRDFLKMVHHGFCVFPCSRLTTFLLFLPRPKPRPLSYFLPQGSPASSEVVSFPLPAKPHPQIPGSRDIHHTTISHWGQGQCRPDHRCPELALSINMGVLMWLIVVLNKKGVCHAILNIWNYINL